MPYEFNSDLPLPVRSHLPEGAQDIYRAAFNSAFESQDRKKSHTGSRGPRSNGVI
jgi:cation transport regulator ChaB